jgi:hypothetical protein
MSNGSPTKPFQAKSRIEGHREYAYFDCYSDAMEWCSIRLDDYEDGKAEIIRGGAVVWSYPTRPKEVKPAPWSGWDIPTVY